MDEPFEFLSHEQFVRLSQPEKLAYLDRAVMALDRIQGRRNLDRPEAGSPVSQSSGAKREPERLSSARD